MEYLIIVGFVIVMLVPATFIYLRYSGSSSDTLSSAKATQIADQIAKAADEVYYLGKDNQKSIDVSFPPNIDLIQFDNKEIVFKVKDSKGNTNDITEVASVPLSGLLPNIQGKKTLVIKSLGDRVSVNVICNDGETLSAEPSACTAFNCRSPCSLICTNKAWKCSACSDSLDNDKDNKIDFNVLGGAPRDLQCTSISDNDENV